MKKLFIAASVLLAFTGFASAQTTPSKPAAHTQSSKHAKSDTAKAATSGDMAKKKHHK